MSSLNGEWSGKVFTDDEIDQFLNKLNIGFIVLSPNSRQNGFSNVVGKLFSKRIDKKINSGGYLLYLIN
jgi:hypothetical protein